MSSSLGNFMLSFVVPTIAFMASAGLVAYNYGLIKKYHITRATETVLVAGIAGVTSFIIGEVLGHYER